MFNLLFQTDKTMAELEIDINMRIREWDVIQVGRQLQFFFLHCQLIIRTLWNLYISAIFLFALPVNWLREWLWNFYISQSPDFFSCSSKFQMFLMMLAHLHWDKLYLLSPYHWRPINQDLNLDTNQFIKQRKFFHGSHTLVVSSSHLNTERSYKRQGHATLKHFVGFLCNGGKPK